MINEAYVSFETAKLLKEKGFNELCSRLIREDGEYIEKQNQAWNGITKKQMSEFYLCPTCQMAMKWLREEHNIIFVFKPASFSGEKCTFWTYELWCGDNFEGEILSFKTYEKAVEAALKYSLENLI